MHNVEVAREWNLFMTIKVLVGIKLILEENITLFKGRFLLQNESELYPKEYNTVYNICLLN